MSKKNAKGLNDIKSLPYYFNEMCTQKSSAFSWWERLMILLIPFPDLVLDPQEEHRQSLEYWLLVEGRLFLDLRDPIIVNICNRLLKSVTCKGWSISVYIFKKSEQCSDLGGLWEIGYTKTSFSLKYFTFFGWHGSSEILSLFRFLKYVF